MTPQSIITEARDTLNDTNAVLYRASDAELVRYVNAGLAEMSRLNPALFHTLGDLDCIANQCDQKITFADAQALVDILCIHDGDAVGEADMTAMDSFMPSWRTVAAAPAVQWMRKANDPLRFFVYPKAPVDQVLDVMYVRNPATVTLNDPITDVPPTFSPALALYLIYRTEFKDDEHANSGRSAQAYQAFVAMIKGAA